MKARYSPKKIRALSGPVSLVTLFGLFCVLRLWYAMLIFFALAVFLTLILGKRSYCYYLCPLGTATDFFFDPKEKAPKKRLFPPSVLIPAGIFLLFWGYVVWASWVEVPDQSRWRFFLYFAWAVLGLSAGLQWFFGKREWCVSLCPLGVIQRFVLRFRKRSRRP